MRFAHLLFGQPHQVVVQVDRFQRLDEQRVAAGACAVDDAADLLALSGDHRHHETLVANRDNLLLQHALFLMGAQEPLERIMNGLLLLFDFAPQAGEGDTGVVGDGSVRQNFARDLLQYGAKFTDGQSPASQPWEPLRYCVQNRFDVRGPVEERDQVEDLFGLEACALDAQLFPGDPQVGDAGKVQPDCGSALRRLRLSSRAEVLDRFVYFGESGCEYRQIGAGCDPVQLRAAERARDVAAEQPLERIEFEQFRAGGFHSFWNAFSITGRVPSVIRYCDRSVCSTQRASLTSSPGWSAPPVTRHR